MTKVNQIVDIRIPKKDANTARGFAYIELVNNTDYEVCNSFILNIRINHVYIIHVYTITYYYTYLLTESTFTQSFIY